MEYYYFLYVSFIYKRKRKSPIFYQCLLMVQNIVQFSRERIFIIQISLNYSRAHVCLAYKFYNHPSQSNPSSSSTILPEILVFVSTLRLLRQHLPNIFCCSQTTRKNFGLSFSKTLQNTSFENTKSKTMTKTISSHKIVKLLFSVLTFSTG